MLNRQVSRFPQPLGSWSCALAAAAMAAERCGPEQAFDILRRASQGRNQKLREVAAGVVRRHAEGAATSP